MFGSYTRSRYQVIVYRTIGPFAFITILIMLLQIYDIV